MKNNSNTLKINNSKTDTTMLLIEYPLFIFATEHDFKKHRKVTKLINHQLKSEGLGRCNGGSMFGWTMQICCDVTNPSKAIKFIKKLLDSTQYSDYNKVYEADEAYFDDFRTRLQLMK